MKHTPILFFVVAALLFLTHCSSKDDDGASYNIIVACLDGDADGYTVDAGESTTDLVACTTLTDCDDTNQNIFPGAIDTLGNDIDEDCSGGDGSAADDIDFDGIDDLSDNCPDYHNESQADTDGDGHGDSCDLWPTDASRWDDSDGDGVDDNLDVCPEVSDADNQVDADADGYGVSCDLNDADAGFSVDADVDGFDDLLSDNCPELVNADQYDTDHDGQGNACDTDDDNDNLLDYYSDGVTLFDLCPLTANDVTSNIDSDGDGIGDACEDDADTDGIDNLAADNCPDVANPGQEDNDGDGIGDACETTEETTETGDEESDGGRVSNFEHILQMLSGPIR